MQSKKKFRLNIAGMCARIVNENKLHLVNGFMEGVGDAKEE